MSLRARLTLVGLAVLAVTIAAVGLVVHELSRVQGRNAVDRAIRQELGDFNIGFPLVVAAQTGGGTPSPADVVVAAERYLAVNPGSDRHLTVITVGADRISTADGPAMLLDLYDDDQFPTGTIGQLETVDTARGPTRVLTAPLNSGTELLGTIAIAGPLTDVIADARNTVIRIAIAGIIGLAVGAAAITILTRRALAPLTRLADAARTIDANDLTVRVPEPTRRDEVGVVAHEFNHMLDRLADAAQRRQQLLASISHELRTPVAVASGHLEMFETLGPTDEQNATRLAAIVHTELQRLSRIIEDLSAVAHGTDDTPIDIGPVFLPDLFDALHERAAGLNITHLNLADPPPIVVDLDHNRMLQTLLNLVVNASIHTPHGTNITVTAAESPPTVTFTVHDDGPGIAPELIDNVFEPFVTSRPGGPNRSSGLGLPVARTYAEAHHGTLELDTTPAGTTATITIPYQPVTGTVASPSTPVEQPNRAGLSR